MKHKGVPITISVTFPNLVNSKSRLEHNLPLSKHSVLYMYTINEKEVRPLGHIFLQSVHFYYRPKELERLSLNYKDIIVVRLRYATLEQ